MSATAPSTNGGVSESPTIYIPHSERARAVSEVPLSVRLRHVLEAAKVRVFGDLHGRTYEDIGKLRNCGKSTVSELAALVNGMLCGSITPGVRMESQCLEIPIPVRVLCLAEIPLSVRLENVLRRRGATTLGDLHGMDLNELHSEKNCGKKSIAELRQLARRAGSGEFDVEKAGNAPLEVVACINAGIAKLGSRNRKIVADRFGAQGAPPMTLEETGALFRLTRERIRQIVRDALKAIRRFGGRKLQAALDEVTRHLEELVCPLTPELFAQWLGSDVTCCGCGVPFYLRVLEEIEPRLSLWPEGQDHRGSSGARGARDEPWFEDLYALLQRLPTRPSVREALELLHAKPKHRALEPIVFLAALRATRTVTVEFTQPDRPELRLARLRVSDCGRAVLETSDEPLTLEEILDQARQRFGTEVVAWSPRAAENGFALLPDFFRLGPRSFGLRRHFRLPKQAWPEVCAQFEHLLIAKGRPVSTIDAERDGLIEGLAAANSYELAEILRLDKRFTDLGRRLFGLTAWGVQEREYVKDLIPRVLAEAGRPLTAQGIIERIQRLRSFSPHNMTTALQRHPEVRRAGFGYWALRSSNDDFRGLFSGNREVVEHAVRRAELPLTFAGLCGIFGFDAEHSYADRLWAACVAVRLIRRSPKERSPGTVLLHERCSFERVLVTAAKALGRPAPAYEIQWELAAQFGDLFTGMSAADLEERLKRSPRFVHNAAGEFALEEQIPLADFDLDVLRNAVMKLLAESGEIVGCDDLLDRLESEGIELDELSPDFLASILRGTPGLDEIGKNRFRATQ